MKAPLIHYYFPTLDDLFIAGVPSAVRAEPRALGNALEGDDPLQALWNYANDRTHVVLTFEFLALANHRKAIQAELGEVAERFRKVELEAFTAMAASSGIDLDEFPPDALLLIMMAIPTTVVYEEAIGMSTGHEQRSCSWNGTFRSSAAHRSGDRRRPRAGEAHKEAGAVHAEAGEVHQESGEVHQESGEADEEGGEVGQESHEAEHTGAKTATKSTKKLSTSSRRRS